ncbi:Uma2 family endonuclease [Sorangium sp. So ce513]|uniref:Uma2 family endonuclease n=1 Tax=Sorangium sp. So ce513 TaxID=3133315 RepID=UPI003F62AD1D
MSPTAGRPSTTKGMTFDEAARLDPDAQPGELVDGEWVPMTKNTWRHGELVVNVSVLLKLYAREHPGWSVAGGDPGTRLARNPDRLRGPDVAMARTERLPKGKGAEGWLDGAPDLAVEILGDGQSASDVLKKALEYLAAGAAMVWVIDADPQRVMVLTPPDHVRILGRDDALDGGAALPGFSCKVADLFG